MGTFQIKYSKVAEIFHQGKPAATPSTRMASRLAEDNTRAKCTQVIIVKERVDKGVFMRRWAYQTVQARQNIGTYLHPASLSLLVYIFPISPIPIMPTAKFSIA